MSRLAALLFFLVALAACEKRDRFAAPDSSSSPPPPLPPERSAYLSVSELSPAAGTGIVVAGVLRVGSDLSLGSFRVRLGYDSTMLHFVEEIPTPGMLRVVNPGPGDVIVAGASSGSTSDGRLFTLRFRVDDPAGVNSLVLRIDELNDATFADQKQGVTRTSRLIRDRSLDAAIPSANAPPDSTARRRGAPVRASQLGPIVDSISPRSAVLEREGVTDIAIYGKGFARERNVVSFGEIEVPGLMSEADGTLIRLPAPVRYAKPGRIQVRVKHDGKVSNAVVFIAKDEER